MYPYPPWTCTATSQALFAFSEANTFAIDPSRVNGFPASFCAAARRASSRAASNPVAASASMKRMAWLSAMGWPNARRSFAYRMAASRAAVPMPIAWQAIPTRPESSALSAIGKPRPSGPSMALSGTRRSSKARETVLEARRPILSSCLPTWRPLLPPSTRKALIPLVPGSPVRAQTMITPARSPEVIHCLLPLITYSAPSRRAVVRSGPAADDGLGHQVVHRHRHRRRGAALRDLHHRQGVGDGPGGGAPVLLGHVDAHQPELRQLGELLAGKTRLAVELGGDRGQGLLRVVAGGIADQRLRLVQVEESRVHLAARLCSRRGARARVHFVRLFELRREVVQPLAQHCPIDQHPVNGDELELPRHREALLADAPAGVSVLAQHTQPDEVVDRARERGVPPRQPPLQGIRLPVARAQRHDVPDVHVDVADAGHPPPEQQRREERRAERLPGREPVGHLRSRAPAFFWCRTLNHHRTSPPGFVARSAHVISAARSRSPAAGSRTFPRRSR